MYKLQEIKSIILLYQPGWKRYEYNDKSEISGYDILGYDGIS